MPGANRLRFGVLGPVQAELDGVPLPLGTTRQRALLALLALEAGRVVLLDTVVDALWSEDVPDRAEVSVRSYVSNLRRVLEPDRPPRAPAAVLRTEGTGYALAVPDDAVDALRFGRLVRRAAQAEREGDARGVLAVAGEAVALWRGPALVDVSSVPFAVGVATRLELERARVDLLRLRALVDLGAPDDAVDDLAARVEADPADEAATGVLMRALYQLGRPADALDRYEVLRSGLAERGLLPSVALQDLEGSVLRHDPQLLPAGQPAAAHRTVPPPVWLVGRDDAWALLAPAASRSAGTVTWRVLAGEAGIGKTFLAEAFADGFDGEVRWGRARRDADQPPFWLWRRVVDRADGPVTADDVIERLAGLARDRPVLVVLDDVQWADSASLAVLGRVAADLRRAEVTFLLTVRPSPEPAAVDAALDEVLHRPDARRVALAPLDDAALRSLADAAVVELDQDELAALRRRTGGNPLFVTEVLRIPPAEWTDRLPPDVAAAAGARLEPLPAPTSELLALAALAGDDIDVELLALATGTSTADVLTGLGPAVRVGIVADHPLRFRHSALRDVVVSTISGADRRTGHACLADALRPPWPSARRVHHLAEARPVVGVDDLVEAVDRAADDAASVGAFGEQARLLEVALADRAVPDERRLALTIRAGEARTRAGDDLDAQAHVAAALDLADRLGDTTRAAEAVRVVARGGGAWYWVPFGQHPVELLARIERAVSATPQDDPAHGLLLAALAVGEAYGPDQGRPQVLADRALELARAHGDTTALAEALVAASWAGFGVAPPADLLALADELAALGALLPPERRALTHGFRLAAALRLGDLERASASLAAGESEARAQRLPAFAATFGWARATVLATGGDLGGAEHAAADAYALHLRTQVYAADLARQLVALHLAEQRGTIGAAAAEADELALLDDHAFLYQALATDPRVTLERDVLEPRLAAVLDEAPAWHRVVRLSMVALLSARLASTELADRVEAALAPYADEVVVVGTALASAGPVRRIFAVVSRAAGRNDDAVHHARAAVEIAEGSGLRGWLGPVHLELARALHAVGARKDAAEAAATATDLAARMGQDGIAEAAARLRRPLRVAG